MATYLALNLLFLGAMLVVLRAAGTLRWDRKIIAMLLALLVLTAIFDSLIITTGIVAYDADKLLGLTIGAAPIEDFFYTILVAIMIPALWKKLESRRA